MEPSLVAPHANYQVADVQDYDGDNACEISCQGPTGADLGPVGA